MLVAGLLLSNSVAILALFLLGRGSPQFRAQIHPLILRMQLCAQSTRMFSTPDFGLPPKRDIELTIDLLDPTLPPPKPQ